MERTQDKPSTTQDLKQNPKDPKHEGARESRPDRPLAAEGKPENKENKTAQPGASEENVTPEQQGPGAEARGKPVADDVDEGTDDLEAKDDEAPSKAI